MAHVRYFAAGASNLRILCINRISPNSVKKRGQYEQKFIHASKVSTAWLSLSRFSRNSRLLDKFFEKVVCRTAWKSDKRFSRWLRHRQTHGRRSYLHHKERHDHVDVTVLVDPRLDSPSVPRRFATKFHCDVPRNDVTTFVMFLRNRFCECSGLMEAATWPSGLWPSCYDWGLQGP